MSGHRWPLVSGFTYIDFSNFAVAVAKWAKRTCARDSAHVRTMVSNDYWSSMCTQLSRFSLFFFFFFFLRLGNLEPRLKFQRALRPKEEDRRGLDKLSRRGAATNGFSSFGSVFWVQRMGSHCYYFVIVLVLVYVVIVVVLSGRFACRPIIQIQSSWASRFFY